VVRSRILLDVLVTWLGLAVLPARGGEIHHDFRGDRPWKKLFRPVGPNPTQFMTPDPSGLVLHLPAKTELSQPVGLTARFGVHGDFEITLGFVVDELETPTKGRGAGVSVWINASNPTSDAATLSWVMRPDGSRVFTSHRASTSASSQREHSGGPPLSTDAASGRLRLTRKDQTLSYLVAPADSKDFREIHRTSFGPEHVRSIRFAVDNGGSPTLFDARFLWIDVKSQDADEVAAEEPASSSMWPMVFGAMLLAGGGGFLVFRSRRRREQI
jgi:LPXTG-motif cell wall-anchored protein